VFHGQSGTRPRTRVWSSSSGDDGYRILSMQTIRTRAPFITSASTCFDAGALHRSQPTPIARVHPDAHDNLPCLERWTQRTIMCS